MKISIIIPVYNVEHYLRQCIDSVLAQTYTDFEVLLINDGSTDSSGLICDEYAARDSRIKVFHKENGGVSSARNLGLDNAQGEWIAFVDSDDEINNEYLSDLVAHATEFDLDMIYPQIQFIDSLGKKGKVFDRWERTKIEDGFVHKRRGFIFALYNKKIIGKTRFNTAIVIAEDTLFNIMMHSFAKRIVAEPNAIYYYRKHSHSVTSNALVIQSDRTFDGIIANIKALHEFIANPNHHITKDRIVYYDRPFYLLGKMALQSVILPKASVEKLNLLKKTFFENNLHHINKRLSQEYSIYNKRPIVFYLIQSLKNIYFNTRKKIK